MSANALHRDRTKTYNMESRAFYLGAHGISPEPVMAEIEAKMKQDTSEERGQLLRSLRKLEGTKERIARELPEAETVWIRIREDLGDVPPPFFHAVFMVIFASFALAVDTLFLAPSMDILNVVNLALQFVAAAGIAVFSTIWFEFSGLIYLRSGRNLAQRASAVATTGIGVFCLIAWGLLRGYQLKFAAGLASNPLGDFLGQHPILTSIFFIFVTLGTPIVGAVALLNAWNEASPAFLWRKVRNRYEELRSAEVETARQVQSAAEELDYFDQKHDAACDEWKAIFNQFYARGLEIGARKETRASVIRKSAVGGTAAIVPAGLLAFVLPMMFVPELVVIPVVVGVGLFTYFNHRRHHPEHDRYLAQENTRFAVIPDAPHEQKPQAPPPRQLTKGDPK